MPVDFVKSDGGKNQPKRSGYDIEYTNPKDQPVEPKPERGNFLSWFSKPKTPSYAPVPKAMPTQSSAEAKSAAAPVTGKTSYQPVNQSTTGAAVQSTVVAQPQSKTPLGVLHNRQLPPAPLPPMHAAPIPVQSKTVSPKVAPTIPVAPSPVTQSVTPTPTPPVQPVRPQPMAPVVAAGAPVTASAHHVTNVGEVVAQNVIALRGQMSNPEIPHPNVVTLNLLPNAILRSASHQSPLVSLLRVGTLSMLCLTAVYLTMVCYQAFYVWRTQAAVQQLHSLDSTILGYRGLQSEINASSNTLTAVQTMLDEHVYWTQWFSYLERSTLQSVYYTNFSGSTNGTMNLQAIAPDFATVAQQIALFQSLPEVTAVEVNTATRSGSLDATTEAGTVQFSVSLQVDPAILHYQVADLYGN